MRNAHKNSVKNTAGKRPLASKWYNIIKADHDEISYETVDSIYLFGIGFSDWVLEHVNETQRHIREFLC
jgi:hypothetical protein